MNTQRKRTIMSDLPGRTTVVVGPSRGLGRGIARAFIAGYAQDESRRAGLDITVTAVMPRMTPFGDVGRRGVRAYAARGCQTEEAYLKQLGALLTPQMAGAALADLVQANPATTAPGTL